MKPDRTVVFSFLGRMCAVLSSGILLYCAFPPLGDRFAAWMALMPLIILCRYTRPSQSFKWGYFCGLIFWLMSLSWLLNLGRTGTHISLAALGWVLLSAYAAVYTGVFAFLTSRILRCEESVLADDRPEKKVALWRIAMIAVLPVMWVGLEYLRSTIFTGFAWNQLGVSQYSNLSVAQIAEWGGVYLVSAVVVVMNTAVAMTGVRLVSVYRHREKPSRMRYELMLGLLVCAFTWMYGTRTVMKDRAGRPDMKEVRIAAIQPNTPQIKKWDLDYELSIYERLREQTVFASMVRPDLIIWPETAVVRPYNLDEMTRMYVAELASSGSPILVGAMEKVKANNPEGADKEWLFYNSSFLVAVDGRTTAVYRKQHLVPFGEYVPLENQVALIKRCVPLGFSCTAGESNVLMNVTTRSDEPYDAAFSVLICFEDIVASISRTAVREGAEFLVNQTNDAWFDGTAAPLQHMSHCVFRAIENRVPVVRAANTGVTCFIDRYGRIDMFSSADNKNGLAVKGFKPAGLMVAGSMAGATLYNRCGDFIFAFPCAAAVVIILLFLLYRRLRSMSLFKAGRPGDGR